MSNSWVIYGYKLWWRKRDGLSEKMFVTQWEVHVAKLAELKTDPEVIVIEETTVLNREEND